MLYVLSGIWVMANLYFQSRVSLTLVRDDNCVTFVFYLPLTLSLVHCPQSELCLADQYGSYCLIAQNFVGAFVYAGQNLLLCIILLKMDLLLKASC